MHRDVLRQFPGYSVLVAIDCYLDGAMYPEWCYALVATRKGIFFEVDEEANGPFASVEEALASNFADYVLTFDVNVVRIEAPLLSFDEVLRLVRFIQTDQDDEKLREFQINGLSFLCGTDGRIYPSQSGCATPIWKAVAAVEDEDPAAECVEPQAPRIFRFEACYFVEDPAGEVLAARAFRTFQEASVLRELLLVDPQGLATLRARAARDPED